MTQLTEPISLQSMTSMKNIGSSDFDGFDSPIMTGCSPGREKGAIMLYETLPS